VVLLTVGLGTFFFLKEDSSDTSNVSNKTPSKEVTPLIEIAEDEMLQHSTANDCWLVIHNQVYDLTDFAPEHPGGASLITQLCGENATEAFQREHTVDILQLAQKYRVGDFASKQVETTDPPSDLPPGSPPPEVLRTNTPSTRFPATHAPTVAQQQAASDPTTPAPTTVVPRAAPVTKGPTSSPSEIPIPPAVPPATSTTTHAPTTQSPVTFPPPYKNDDDSVKEEDDYEEDDYDN